MMNLITLILMSFAYRMRGWGGFLYGTFSRRLFWSASTGASCLLLGADVYTSIAASIGAFVGMWIEHGHCYTVNDLQQAVSLGAIGCARVTLLTWPMPFSSQAALFGLILMPLAYFLGTRLSKKLKWDSMWIAEPLAGSVLWLFLS